MKYYRLVPDHYQNFFQGEEGQLSAIHVARLHTALKEPSPVYLKGCEETREDKDFNCSDHMKPHKMLLMESLLQGSKVPKKSSNSLQFLESFGKQFHFRSRHPTSLDEDEDPCLICHDDLQTSSIRELHCRHRFHKECIEKWLDMKQTCPTCRSQTLLPQ
ncbi:E3 ubiquitin-protein ligase MPSR1 isoform X1 [Microcaecilia unicolor]|uniref:E3 ubiquitin-protein ligase MPSR1-like isoform X1 n=1 Tax=Microcaecilia unicolor TaxID=1415580 RepID=A0A6P7Y4V3_9AMPH|nr:E3 ubiquitin-protein ligase MPSR1-like isoform X1 [Microcaecilia unicolor]